MAHLRGLSSFRDIGNIRCSDGRKTVCGKLYRSGHLGKLSAEKLEKLDSVFGVKYIADLRTAEEKSDNPENISSALGYFHIPLLTNEQNPVINRKSRLSMLKKIISEGGASKHLCEVYALMGSSELTLSGLREFLEKLSLGSGAYLWHCTQGKDRTGICSAALLMALGCERDEIIKDYMAYNKTCRVKNFFIYIGVSVFTFSIKKASELMKLLTSREEFIASFFGEIDRCFGSDECFLRNGIGISDETVCKLKKLYLI